MKWILFFLFAITENANAQRNVGINTRPAIPYTLHLHDSTIYDVSIGFTNAMTTADPLRGGRVRFLNHDFNFMNYEPTGSINIATNFITRMTVSPNGNVGINNQGPAEKLEVDGNIRFKGLLMPNGDAGLPGQALFSNGPLLPQWRTVNSNPQIGFRAAANTEQLVDYATQTKVKFSNIGFNDGSGYNAVSGDFTCPETGRYKVDANVIFDAGGSIFPADISLLRAGVPIAIESKKIESSGYNLSLSTFIDLTAGDQIAVWVYVGLPVGGVPSAQILSRAAGNFFSCYKVY